MNCHQPAFQLDDSHPTLALATNSRGKIAEFRSLLGDRANFASLEDLGLESPEETGATFEENAALKAQFVFERAGFVTLADDSGLAVDALDGLPGVRSARYAGDHHDDSDNRALLLSNLSETPSAPRIARFVAALAIIDRSGALSLFRGTCEGAITLVGRGCNGFGYDPIFELPNGQTLAELDPREKNIVSHRGQALRLALPTLLSALNRSREEMGETTP